MRTFVTSLLALVGLGAFAAPLAAQTDGNFAYINSQRIIAEAPEAQQAQQTFEQEMQQYRSELQDLEQEIQTLMQEYEQRQATLSAEARQRRQQEIQEKQQAYQQRAQELQQRAAQRQSELVEPIMRQIESVIDDLRQERGYTMIFDVAAGGLIAADPGLDITNEVLNRLNEGQ